MRRYGSHGDKVRRVRGGGSDGGKRLGDDALELGDAGHVWLADAHVGAGVRASHLESPLARRVLRPDRRRMHWRHRMRERWERMSPEERERFMAGMQRGCGRFASRTTEPVA